MYRVIYNDCAGKNTRSKCQRTKESMINICTLLDCIPMTTYNWINWKRLRLTIINNYKLVRLHVQRSFRISLSVRVSVSDHPIKCTIKYCTNKPFHKLNQCIPARSTRHYILLHKYQFMVQPPVKVALLQIFRIFVEGEYSLYVYTAHTL